MILDGEVAAVDTNPFAAVGIWSQVDIQDWHAAELVFVER
jgi:hypothetical protein